MDPCRLAMSCVLTFVRHNSSEIIFLQAAFKFAWPVGLELRLTS